MGANYNDLKLTSNLKRGFVRETFHTTTLKFWLVKANHDRLTPDFLLFFVICLSRHSRKLL